MKPAKTKLGAHIKFIAELFYEAVTCCDYEDGNGNKLNKFNEHNLRSNMEYLMQKINEDPFYFHKLNKRGYDEASKD